MDSKSAFPTKCICYDFSSVYQHLILKRICCPKRREHQEIVLWRVFVRNTHPSALFHRVRLCRIVVRLYLRLLLHTKTCEEPTVHYVAQGVYLERLPSGLLKLSVEDIAMFEGRPMKVRIQRDVQPEKLRAIAPELFPAEAPSIADDVKMLRELIEDLKLPGQVVSGYEGADAALLIERVLDHYAVQKIEVITDHIQAPIL